MNDQIQEWLLAARQSGLDNAAIAAELQKTGWTQDQVQTLLFGGPAAPQPAGLTYQPVVSPKHKKLGILFIILPFGVLTLTLLAWAIVVFALGQTDASYNDSSAVAIIQWALGFLGLLSVISIFVLVPIGIYFLTKKTVVDYSRMDPRSGKGDQSVIPAEISRWNWGAALLTWIWGISNSVWLSLLAFVPIVGWVWWIFLGINGNEWAWKARAWESVEQFRETQREWTKWAFIVVGSVFGLLVIATIFAIVTYSSPVYEVTS